MPSTVQLVHSPGFPDCPAWRQALLSAALMAVYTYISVSSHLYVNIISNLSINLTFVIESNYQYLTQELVHDGPILDLKFDAQFGRLASVGSGFPQVSQLRPLDGGEYCGTSCAGVLTDDVLTLELLKPMVPSPETSKYTATSIHFRDDGASILTCTLETHKVCV